tara:strand:- start:579 stop:746 length:168 start_codon:yes stop_codon:yes gene_type:complete
MHLERYVRRKEANLAHARFNLALQEVSQMQSLLFKSELEREDLKKAFGILRSRMH